LILPESSFQAFFKEKQLILKNFENKSIAKKCRFRTFNASYDDKIRLQSVARVISFPTMALAYSYDASIEIYDAKR